METMKYNLEYFTNVSFNGFDYVIPEDIVKLISSLSMEVGSSSYIKTPVFKKKNNTNADINTFKQSSSTLFKNNLTNKKRKSNKGMEATNEQWETLRSFQSTVIEQKTGIERKIDEIRLMLNKLTDKTFLDIRAKIINIIQDLDSEKYVEEDMSKIGNFILCQLLRSKYTFHSDFITIYIYVDVFP